jgi:hypothetical protein
VGGAAAIYEDCSLLARGFSSIKFFYCLGERNVVAHNFACNVEGPQSIVLHEVPPDFLIGLLANNVNLFPNIKVVVVA